MESSHACGLTSHRSRFLVPLSEMSLEEVISGDVLTERTFSVVFPVETLFDGIIFVMHTNVEIDIFLGSTRFAAAAPWTFEGQSVSIVMLSATDVS